MLGKTKLQSLISKSNNIVSIFEKTKNDINKINDEIVKELSDRSEQIQSLNTELTILGEQMIKNNKVLTNIDKFFE